MTISQPATATVSKRMGDDADSHHSTRDLHPNARAAEDVLQGVDTHKHVHVAAVITMLGGLIDTRSFPAATYGYGLMLARARSFGTLRRTGVECTGSYGAGQSRHLRAHGVEVVEVNQPDRAASTPQQERRGRRGSCNRGGVAGAGDLGGQTGDGAVEMLRLFRMAKNSAIKPAPTRSISSEPS